MQSKFLMLIALVVIITLGLGMMIWRQTIQVQKKALAAKQRQKMYEEELRKQIRTNKQAAKNSESHKK